jgi:superfamily II DNA or RNA helicase
MVKTKGGAMITLYEHNQKAYSVALSLMTETGKAAVIHPTGTGKSFIGFKLAEQHSGSRVCWLSPSEYIYKTQLENLKAAADGYQPDNICFMTYAKLMLVESDGIKEIKPDFIVLDEFHRCGAVKWSKGVELLLSTFPNVPILGLSATNIRYLDNQRDMADELFDGNVASEMTLGEAIARNILLPPVYVTSVYSYQKDLEKYQSRVKKAKNPVVRDSAQKYLDSLRRALTKADGLDVIFDKHIKDRHGKYIVFCANVRHMNDMIERVPEWFGKIDSEPHIYSVYSDDMESDKAFEAFKQDESEHLKLLFCIDMLNEGVHVEDVSGVILFRPTVSPTIYKQQIGRALSASKNREPVIFDIVNNFENLYSISSIEEEMQEAIVRYNRNGESEKIVNKNFHVIDEVKDCKQIFEALQDILTASWEAYFETTKEFFAEYGHLDIPTTYRHKNLALGKWIYSQRRIKKGEIAGHLSAERIELLDSINMLWEHRRDIPWKTGIEHAREYRETFGDLLVPVKYISPDGYKLGEWITYLRQIKSNKERRGQLSEEKIKKLDELGMVWNKFDLSFEQNFAEAKKYYKENGNLLAPVNYVTQDGIKLGAWLHQMRCAKKETGKAQLGEERIKRLNSIGMQWNVTEDNWEKGYREAEKYYKANKNMQINTVTVTESGFPLGKWLYSQKLAYVGYKGRKQLAPEKAKRLESIGMIFDMVSSRK